MKLTLLLTHAIGDWYLPLSCLDGWKKQFNCDEVEILVDSIYFVNPNKYYKQAQFGEYILDSIGYNWNCIPFKFFGSGDYHGIKNRVIGPQYNDIKYDLMFYREPQLKEYVRDVILPATDIFISGCNKHSFQWKNNTNIPLSFKNRKIIKLFNGNAVSTDIYENAILIHVRKRGNSINDSYYQNIIDYCNCYDIRSILIGSKEEVEINNTSNDYRGNIDIRDIFKLIETCNCFIGNNSLFTMHRVMTNKASIIGTACSNGNQQSFFIDEDTNNQNFVHVDTDKEHMDVIFKNIMNWKTHGMV